MPSYLGVYPNCASKREEKFLRAVDSFLNQDYSDKELIIVSDGCHKTNELYLNYYRGTAKIRIISKDFDGDYNGNNRQKGIDACFGDYITYLDTDDFYGSEKHLSSIMRQSQNYDFVYFDDFVFMGTKQNGELDLLRREAELEHKKIGTTFIAHKKVFRNGHKPSWEGCKGYGEDWQFIRKTMKHFEVNRVSKIQDCCYVNCHVPYLNVDN